MVDLYKPMHFTIEQSEWVKLYSSIKRYEGGLEMYYQVKTILMYFFNKKLINSETYELLNAELDKIKPEELNSPRS